MMINHRPASGTPPGQANRLVRQQGASVRARDTVAGVRSHVSEAKSTAGQREASVAGPGRTAHGAPPIRRIPARSAPARLGRATSKRAAPSGGSVQSHQQSCWGLPSRKFSSLVVGVHLCGEVVLPDRTNRPLGRQTVAARQASSESRRFAPCPTLLAGPSQCPCPCLSISLSVCPSLALNLELNTQIPNLVEREAKFASRNRPNSLTFSFTYHRFSCKDSVYPGQRAWC